METKVLQVEGMSCGHCVKAVTEAVGEIPGVNNVDVNLNKATVSFVFNPAETPLENIKAAIIEAGFTVK